MSKFEQGQTAKMHTYDKFATPSEAIEKLTLLAVDLIQGKELSGESKKIVADCIMDYVRIKSAQTKGRPKKWNSIKEKNDFFNAKRRTKKMKTQK